MQDKILKLNEINRIILMPIMAITFIAFNTVVNLWLGSKAETLQNILAILILFTVACTLLSSPKKELLPWIKSNLIVIVYLIVRGISFIESGFDYSVLRTIFFEMFFLIGITGKTVGNERCGRIYLYIFLIIETIVCIGCMAVYAIGLKADEDTISWLTEYTYYEQFNKTALLSNSNTAGIMAVFAIISIVILWKHIKKSKIIIPIIISLVLNIVFMFMAHSRSAEVGLIAAAVFFIVMLFIKKPIKRQSVFLVLCGCIVFVFCVYGFTNIKISEDPYNLDTIETTINDVSSNRYAIWKSCIIEQENHFWFGAGNLAMEQDNRTELFGFDGRYTPEIIQGVHYGPHSGYIGMISGAGWLGFALFVMILFQRIRRAEILKEGNWYLAIIFILAINLFESLFVLNRFFTCFYMFMILEMQNSIEDANDNDKSISTMEDQK